MATQEEATQQAASDKQAAVTYYENNGESSSTGVVATEGSGPRPTTADGIPIYKESEINKPKVIGTAPPDTPASDDPSAKRLDSAGATEASTTKSGGEVKNMSVSDAGGNSPADKDWRVRLSMHPGTVKAFPGTSPILAPLTATQGLVFPYIPTVSISHAARYGSGQVTHSNYNSYFYEGSEVSAISITGDFSVQNIQEGQYLMAAIHFLRMCTKMFYGKDKIAGTPPVPLFLNGFGATYLPNVPVVVTTFSHTMPAEVDYVEIPVGTGIANTAGNPAATTSGNKVRLPTMSQISVTLQPIYSRTRTKDFNVSDYAFGKLIKSSGSATGGFL